MKMKGIYRIALLPGTDESAFVKHMTDTVFTNPSAVQLTRITRGITHQLLKGRSEFREYAWFVIVDLMTDHGYDFAQNVERMGKAIDGMAVVIGLDVYTNVQS